MSQTLFKTHVRTVLPGFDPETVIAEYLSGKYDHLIPSAPKSEIFRGNTIIPEDVSIVGTTPTGHRIIFDGPQVYSYVNQEQRPFYICFWCRRKFAWPFIGEAYQLVKVPKKEAGSPDYIIPCKGTFCTFECHESYISDCYQHHSDHGCTSKNIAHTLFANLYPGEILKEAPHFSMLNINGGPLDEETFFSGEHRWTVSGKFEFKPFGHVYTAT